MSAFTLTRRTALVATCLLHCSSTSSLLHHDCRLQIIMDGTMEHHSALLLENYLDKPHTGGDDRYSDAQLADFITSACAGGFDIMVHAIGDRAIKQTIDAFEAVRKAGHASNRLCLTHAELLLADQAARLAPLDITLQSTGLWMMPNPPLIPILGWERYNKRYCFTGAIAAGTNFALGSDWPATVGG